MQRAQKNSEDNQQQRPPGSMANHLPKRLTFPFAARDRKRQRGTDQERKRGLNEVVERAPSPLDVLGIESEQSPTQNVRERLRNQRLAHTLTTQQDSHRT